MDETEPRARPATDAAGPPGSQLAEPARILASVDAGSNSVHVLVAGVRETGGHELQPLVDESVFLGLGHRVDSTGLLGAEARAALVDVLAGYVTTARDLGTERVILLGTEPLRRAADAALVVAAIEAAARVALHVISHDEEAHLTLLGVTGGRSLEAELAVVDVGGGSTEVVDARRDGSVTVDAVAIGSARLTAGLVAHDPPTRREIAALHEEAVLRVAALPGSSARDVIAAGGTASNLVRILGPADPGVDGAGSADGIPAHRLLTRARLDEALEILLAGPAVDVAERFGLNPVRARVLPAGAAIVRAILDRYGVASVRVAEEGLREGAVLAAAHAGPSWRDRLPRLVAGWD